MNLQNPVVVSQTGTVLKLGIIIVDFPRQVTTLNYEIRDNNNEIVKTDAVVLQEVTTFLTAIKLSQAQLEAWVAGRAGLS